MRIAVPLRGFINARMGGLQNYIRHVVGALDERHDVTAWVPRAEAARIRGFAPRAHLLSAPGPRLGFSIEPEFHAGEHDLLLCLLAFLDPIDPPLPCAVEINDLQHEYLPQNFSAQALSFRRERYRGAARRADVVLTPSRFSRDCIVECYDIDPARIAISGRSVDRAFAAAPQPGLCLHLDLPARYVHYPANFWAHKNHGVLLDALAAANRSGAGISLVLTGAPESGWPAVAEQVRERGLRDAVRMLGYLPRPWLVEVVRGAHAVVFPSRFEGFGAPLLEAFTLATPVIASTAGALPEVAGDAALLVDPDDADAWSQAILRVLADDEHAAQLLVRGAAQVAMHRWPLVVERVERQLHSLLTAVAHEP